LIETLNFKDACRLSTGDNAQISEILITGRACLFHILHNV